MKSGLRKVSLIALACSISRAALATDYTALAGGSGGNAFNLDCGANMSLVGIQGKAGSLIDSVQGVCAQLNADGSQLGRKVLTGIAGGGGGGNYSLQCLNGTTVTGIAGHADSHLNNFKVRCSGTTPDFTASAGNPSATGPGPWFSLVCPARMDARLMRGRSGIWVDALGLGCKPAQKLAVSEVRTATQVRQGQMAPLTVTMSLVPVEPISVHLSSSNPELPPSTGVVAVGTTTTTATATVAASKLGCARITASFKGSSASADLVVHSAASPAIAVTGPVILKRGSSASLRLAIPSALSRNSNIPVNVVGTSRLGTVATFANHVVNTSAHIPANTLSASLEIYAQNAGCALVTAREDKAYGATVTHTIVVVD